MVRDTRTLPALASAATRAAICTASGDALRVFVEGIWDGQCCGARLEGRPQRVCVPRSESPVAVKYALSRRYRSPLE